MKMRMKDKERKGFIFSPDLQHRKIGYIEDNVRINWID